MSMAFDKRKALQNALTFTQQGKWDKAITEYQAILKADPRDLTVCNNLGDLYSRAGKNAEAIEQYLKLGELYRADGLSVKSIAVYKKIVKLDPGRTASYLACAELYWEQGLVGEAKIQMAMVADQYAKAGDTPNLIAAYQKLVQFDPANHQVMARLGELLVKEGRREDAAVEYDRAAQAAQTLGLGAESKRLLQKARELAPAALETNVALAEQLMADGKWGEAAEILARLTAADPGDAQAWRLLGELEGNRGRAAEAVAALQQAVTLGLSELEVARPLGSALLAAERVDEAVALCQRITDDGLAQGDPDPALAVCQELVAAAPRAVPLRSYLATLLLNLGREEGARAALYGLAAVHEAEGEPEAALAIYRQLLERDPSDAEAQARAEALAPSPGTLPPSLALEAVPEASADAPAGLQPIDLDDHGALLDAEPSLLLEQAPPAPEEASPFVLPAWEELGLPAPADEATGLEDSTQAEPPEPPVFDFSAFQDLGQASEAEAAKLLFEEESDPVAESAADHLLRLESMEAAPPEPETGSGWMTEDVPALELPALELEEVALELPELVADAAPAEAPASAAPGAWPMEDLSLGELGASVEAGVPTVDFVGMEPAYGGPGTDDGDGEILTRVAEPLAEAEVYLKYGLDEKARERLLEAIRMEPEAVTARRQLLTIYRGRGQADEAGVQAEAIARILEARGRSKSVRQVSQEAPISLVEQADLTDPQGGEAPPDAAPEADAPIVAAEPPEPPPLLPDLTLPVESEPAPAVLAEPESAPAAEPPPEVPLPLDEESAPLLPAVGPTADDDHLPMELRALLEDAEEPAIEILSAGEADDEQAMADDLAEAEFYLAQGMTDEASAVHRRMQIRNPAHPAVTRLTRALAGAPSPAAAEVTELPSATLREIAQIVKPAAPETVEESPLADVAPKFHVAEPPSPGGAFVDLGAELEEEMAAEEAQKPPRGGSPLVDGLLKEFQKGVREQLDEKDYETHYNLGIAYKEMELYDEAIQEFRLTAGDPARALECADLMGLCYQAKGQPEQAIRCFTAGLELDGHAPESYHSLRYDLGVAYESLGDLARALEQFEILQHEGARFRDVQARAQALRTRQPKEPPPAAAAPQEKRRQKKISFI
jgi:pilus assembly protein FimV